MVHLHGWLRWFIWYKERILLCARVLTCRQKVSFGFLLSLKCIFQSEGTCSWRHSSFDREKNGEKTEAKGQPRGGKFQRFRNLVNLKSRFGDIELCVVFIRRVPLGAVQIRVKKWKKESSLRELKLILIAKVMGVTTFHSGGPWYSFYHSYIHVLTEFLLCNGTV